MILRHIGLPLLAVAIGAIAFAVVQAGGAKKAPDKDFAAELPRIEAKEPADALKTIKVAPGFHVELVASEPAIRSPVAIDFDEDGRLFVAEFPEYNQIDNPNFKEHGCIKVLESTKRDWKYDKASVYASGMDSPVAVACWDGGVFVGAVPDLWYVKEAKGEPSGVSRRVIFTGFAKDRAGEAMFNSFRWGLDNRFHVATSNAGGKVRKNSEKDSAAKDVRSQFFIFDPRTENYELTSGAGQHGFTMDDWGNKFVCDNSNPCSMIMYDGRYVARNPYVQAPPVAMNIAEEARTTQLKRLSPPEPWRVLRTKLRVAGEVPGPVETGKPTGHFTGATGVTVYRGDAFPKEYHGNIFVGEVANNLVYRAKLLANGIGFIAKRAEPPDREFLASTDTWFRPVQFANGPDGCLYVIDMYRELIETIVSIPPVILKHLDPASGVNRGRIWRIVPDGFKPPPMPQLSKATTAELVKLLEHPNGWHRDTASRLLYQRQDKATVPLLKTMVRDGKSPQCRLHALWCLRGQKSLDSHSLYAAVCDDEARVAGHAIRLIGNLAPPEPMPPLPLSRAVADDLRRRYQWAWTLGLFPDKLVSRTLVTYAEKDGLDPWMRLAILTSAGERRGEVFSLILDNPKLRTSDHGKALLTALATQIGAANQVDSLAEFVRAIDKLPSEESAFGKELMRQLMVKLPPAARTKIEKAGKAGVLFVELMESARKVANDPKQPVADRVAATRTLSLADFDTVAAILQSLLNFSEPEAVQRAALETLARFDSPRVPRAVLLTWLMQSPQVRATAVETLFSRPAWINDFLDAVEFGKVKRGDVDPSRIAVLKQSADPKLKARIEKLFAKNQLSKRADVIAAYQKALTLKGNAASGKAIFAKNCAACHRLEGVGEQIGAELSGIGTKGRDAILISVLDPNREVLPKFLAYRLVTDAGRTITGMITAETATGITIRRADGTSETVLRVNIEELTSTGMSFMPEGLETVVDQQAMADLLAYLQDVK